MFDASLQLIVTGNTALASISLPSLQSVSVSITITTNTALATLTAPALSTVTGPIQVCCVSVHCI